jgi:hypothetical protein
MGVSIKQGDTRMTLRNLRFPLHMFQLEKPLHQFVVSFSGSKWTESAMTTALKQAQQRSRPWFCRECSGWALCELCGAPRSLAMGCDFLHDDGKTTHMAIFPVPSPCTNPACDNYREKR